LVNDPSSALIVANAIAQHREPRMTHYVIAAEICESPTAQSIAYSAIQQAFQNAMMSGWGTLVGPGPRVVRGRFDGCSLGISTKAAWLIDMPFASSEIEAAQRELYRRLLQNLDALRASAAEESEGLPWIALAGGAIPFVVATIATKSFARMSQRWDVAFLPYTPSASGDISWWQSGAAVNTRTRDSTDWGPKENVLGPDTLLPAQVQLLDRAQQVQSQATNTIVRVGLTMALLIAVVYLVPVLSRWFAARSMSPYGPPRPLPPPLPGRPPPRPVPIPRR
jgi:hypothetical protein